MSDAKDEASDLGGQQIMEWLWQREEDGSRVLYNQLVALFERYPVFRNNAFLLRICYHAAKYCPVAMREYRERPPIAYGPRTLHRAPDVLSKHPCEQLSSAMVECDADGFAVAMCSGRRLSVLHAEAWQAGWQVCLCVYAHLYSTMTDRLPEEVIPLEEDDLEECVGVSSEFGPDLADPREAVDLGLASVAAELRKPHLPAGSRAARAALRSVGVRSSTKALRLVPRFKVLKGGRK